MFIKVWQGFTVGNSDLLGVDADGNSAEKLMAGQWVSESMFFCSTNKLFLYDVQVASFVVNGHPPDVKARSLM